jgi:hypothetical protein
MKSPLPNRRDIVAAAATAVGIHAIAPTATADMPRPALTFRDHLLACLGGPWPEPCPLDVRPREPEVIPGRIGCYGHSMGSTHTWLVGPWDERLKCLVGNSCLPTYAAIERTHLLSPAMWEQTRAWFRRHL